MNTKEQIMDTLIEISNQKLFILREILEITEDQRLSINDENIDHLNDLFEKKQNSIDQINSLDIEFNENLEELKKSQGISSMAELQGSSLVRAGELKEIVGDIIQVMGDIQALEMDNEKKLNDQMTEVKQQLQRINLGNKAVKGYSKPIQPDAFFIDRKK